jgi:hypothetical protein
MNSNIPDEFVERLTQVRLSRYCYGFVVIERALTRDTGTTGSRDRKYMCSVNKECSVVVRDALQLKSE